LCLFTLATSRSSIAMTGRVEGNCVYYSADKVYELAPDFVYIGSFTSTVNMKAENQLNVSSYLLINEVFGKKFNNTNELVEIFIAQYEKLPDRWRVATPGPMNEKFYNFKPTRFTGLAEFLTEKGYTFSTDFFGGLLLGNGYLNTYTKFYFVVSNTVLPTGKDKIEFIRTKFLECVKDAE